MGSSKSAAKAALGKNDYLDQLLPLQLELDRVARWLAHGGRRLLVLVEGRDTAGKGGVISALSERLIPLRVQ